MSFLGKFKRCLVNLYLVDSTIATIAVRSESIA